MTDYKLHILTIGEITVLVKVYKSKRAIAANVGYPGPARVRREIIEHHSWVEDRRMYKPGDFLVLYWTGRLFVEKSEYDLRIDNLQKQWQKRRAKREAIVKAQAEIDAAKATVQDALNFVRESRRNSVNSNVNSNIKAGQNTSEGRDLIDRCEGVK
jgi:hypothetical protein